MSWLDKNKKEVRVDDKLENQDEWVWVEGYKGTDKDMKCRGFQYEFNKPFKEKNVGICNIGFHLCLELGDVFIYYEFNDRNRFFKVKALVNKKELDKYGHRESCFTPSGWSYLSENRIDKLVAKEIVFLQELTFEDLKQSIQVIYPKMDTENDWFSLRKLGSEAYYHKLFKDGMMEIGFSEIFTQILYDAFGNKKNYFKIMNVLDKAKAYVEENISKDMMVYLLSQEVK